MTVTAERFEDVSEPDDAYPFEYRGTVYRFADGDRALLARAYDDEPGAVSFLRWADGLFPSVPRHPLFRDAVAHARRELGATEIRVLLPSGYVRLDAG